MHVSDINELIAIDPGREEPKYLQVSNALIRAIETGKLVKGDQLPSLRRLSEQLDISFDTAKKAYDVLKKRNIVVAAHGKSNVVNATGPIPRYRIFLLFNKLSAHKRIIYDSFTESFQSHAEIDLHVYNNNLHLFRHILKTKRAGYTHFVIIPHLADDPVAIRQIIEEYLANEKIILLDKEIGGMRFPHAAVHEDFENDIYQALSEAYDVLRKYKTLNLVLPEESYYPPEIMQGFEKFCRRHHFDINKRIDISERTPISKGEVFITLSDEDLASLIQELRRRKLKIGKDVGIISYNETPLKEVLLDGITTISTDFRQMGILAAQQIIEDTQARVAVPFRLTLRSSL